MPVDIHDLLTDAAVEQAPRPDYDELWSSGRRQARVRAGAIALSVLAVLGIAGAVVADAIGDRAPAIVDQPGVDGGPAPGDVELDPVSYEIDLSEDGALAPTRTAGVTLATFPEAAGADAGIGAIGRDEKDSGPTALAVLECDVTCTYGFVDHVRNRVVVGDAGGLISIDLVDHGVTNPGSFALAQIRERTVALVTAARDLDGAAIDDLLAIDVETGELLAQVSHGAQVSNPEIRVGWLHDDDARTLRVWVRGGPWRGVLEVADAADGSTDLVAPAAPPTSGTSPVHADLHGAVAVNVSPRVDVTWPRRDATYRFGGAFVGAAHPTHDGLLAVVRQDAQDAEPTLVRIRDGALVDAVRVHVGEPLGTDGPAFVFAPDGTLLTLTSAADRSVVVTAYRPASYAGADPFIGRDLLGPSGQLVAIRGVGWAVTECYVDPLRADGRAVCAAEGSVQEGSRVALVEVTLGADGRPDPDSATYLADLPGTVRADLIGARWAEVGGPLVHLGVKVDGAVHVLELDTGALRRAVDGEFDGQR